MSSILQRIETSRYLSILYLLIKNLKVLLQKITLHFIEFKYHFNPNLIIFTFKLYRLVKNRIVKDSSS